MAKIRRGGVTGFARGRAGNYVYAVMPGSATSSGSREQIVRQAPDGVNNPKTTAQSLQRMKVGPAQRFYNAFNELLSNAFQSVAYGNPSRRYFLSEAMKAEGPYLQKGVDRFIPAEYLFSDGSLPPVPYGDRSAMIETGRLVTGIKVPSSSTSVTAEELATALGVDVNTQITIVVVTNNNGFFEPHYFGFSDRKTIAELPANSYAKKAATSDSPIGFDLDVLGLPLANIVAQAIVLSKQDAGGKWLRSRQYMQVNDDLYNQLYSENAFNAAVLSYSGEGSANALPSSWYYNLGLANQPFNGRIIVGQIPAGYYVNGAQGKTPWVQGTMGAPVTGLYADGTRIMFGSMDGTTAKIICTDSVNGTEYYETKVANWDTTRNKQLVAWTAAYAAQAGLSPKVTPVTLTPNFEFPITVDSLTNKTMTASSPISMDDLVSGLKFRTQDNVVFGVRFVNGAYHLYDGTDEMNPVSLSADGLTITFGEVVAGPTMVSFTFNA